MRSFRWNLYFYLLRFILCSNDWRTFFSFFIYIMSAPFVVAVLKRLIGLHGGCIWDAIWFLKGDNFLSALKKTYFLSKYFYIKWIIYYTCFSIAFRYTVISIFIAFLLRFVWILFDIDNITSIINYYVIITKSFKAFSSTSLEILRLKIRYYRY